MSRIRKSGGYRKLASFQTATLIYDATVWFCEQFLDDRKTRTVDQMIQAARSGRLNIAEGSRASATSTQTELRLINVARSSLEELLLDFEDYLRHRRLQQWPPDSPEALAVRSVAYQRKYDPSDRSDLTELSDQDRWALYSRWLDHGDPAVRANAVICLIHQANFLLDQQIDALEQQFIDEGGYSEQLATARLQRRAEIRSQARPQNMSNDEATSAKPSEATIPRCPNCNSIMALRTAKSGRNAGSQFWGCTNYPQCTGTIPV